MAGAVTTASTDADLPDLIAIARTSASWNDGLKATLQPSGASASRAKFRSLGSRLLILTLKSMGSSTGVVNEENRVSNSNPPVSRNVGVTSSTTTCSSGISTTTRKSVARISAPLGRVKRSVNVCGPFSTFGGVTNRNSRSCVLSPGESVSLLTETSLNLWNRLACQPPGPSTDTSVSIGSSPRFVTNTSSVVPC